MNERDQEIPGLVTLHIDLDDDIRQRLCVADLHRVANEIDAALSKDHSVLGMFNYVLLLSVSSHDILLFLFLQFTVPKENQGRRQLSFFIYPAYIPAL